MRDQSTDPLEQAAHEAEVILERLAAAASFETSPRPATNGQSRNQAPAPVAPADPLPGWSEQSFRDLLEALPDAVVVIDEAGTIVLLNHQAEHLFGYSRAELLGQLIEVLVPERLHDVHVGYRAGYFAAPRVRPLGGRGVRLAGRRKDGSEVPVEISLSPLRTPAGLLVISVIRDVSARQREEAKFRTLVENIPAVTFNAPLDGSVSELYVSPQIEQLLGFSQKEWLDDPVLWHRQLHPEDQERWNLQFAPVCAEGAPFKSVYRFVGKDGRVVWVQGSANLVRDDEGNLLFLQGVAFDVTSIKEAEEALREQASLAGLRAAVSASCTRGEQLPDLLRGCAAALAEHLGAGVGIWACLPGHHTLALQASAGPWPPPGEPARVSEVLAAVSATRQARHVPAAEGTGTLAGYPLLIESHLVGVLTLAASKPFNPATLQTLDLVADQLSLGIERKQAEDALLRANAELDARVQERTEELARSMAELTQKTEELKEFAYSATHDLNAPLFTMGVNTARLAKLTAGQLSEDAAKRITRLMEGLASLDSLIKKLSEFARVIEPKAPGPVDCGQAVAEACAALQAAIDSSGAEITVGELPTVTGVGAFLMLLFQNLLGNAIKYRAPQRPPRIEVGSQRHGEGWLFWVRDNGLGIEDRFFEKIFKLGPEGRLHKQSEIEGCGYGLHICRKIVARHGGRIWVASEFGRGSTFYFTLAAEVVLARTA